MDIRGIFYTEDSASFRDMQTVGNAASLKKEPQRCLKGGDALPPEMMKKECMMNKPKL